MKNSIKKSAVVLILTVLAMTGCSKGSDNNSTTPPAAGTRSVRFKIAGQQYEIDVVRAIYDPTSKTFAIYNNALAGASDTLLTLALGSDFTGSTGTFKGDDNNKGFVFGLASINPLVGYGAGKNDTGNTPETVANTPVSITLTSFSYAGSISATYGNVTAQGTFSGTVYDIKNNVFVALTDGTFNVHP
jgi:hypothetical protein